MNQRTGGTRCPTSSGGTSAIRRPRAKIRAGKSGADSSIETSFPLRPPLRPLPHPGGAENAQEEGGEDDLDPDREQGSSHDRKMRDRLVQSAAVRFQPDVEDVGIDSKAGRDGDNPREKRPFEPESRDELLGEALLPDPVQHIDRLREYSEEKDLHAEDRERTSEKREVGLELVAENLDPGQGYSHCKHKPEDCRSQAGHREEPPRAEQQHEAQMAPSVPPGAQVRAASATVGPETGRH